MEGSSSEELATYRPPEEFEEVKKDALIELNLDDSKELWLIQWPVNQASDLNGQQVSLKLHHDGHLGSFEGSSGKSYEVVSFKSQDPEATVFLSSTSESRIAGKISRRVSLLHYPEPTELKSGGLAIKQMVQRSAASLTNSAHRYTTPTQSTRTRSLGAVSGYTSSICTPRNRSSGSGDASKSPLRRPVDEPGRSIDHSVQDSGKEHRADVSSGSLEHPEQKKSNKKRKSEG
ncbi:mediator-associated protein 2-like [Coffea arabica]|uniref:Mediator-associated protein 2-like n=1 Tax=Coffea arabica TaxID=13443 RepID=A0A6P6XFU9_COFAR|nr:mediator-associated protein 2-like [Coffea arabica]